MIPCYSNMSLLIHRGQFQEDTVYSQVVLIVSNMVNGNCNTFQTIAEKKNIVIKTFKTDIQYVSFFNLVDEKC